VDWGPLDLKDEEMRDYQTVDYCIQQINREPEKPFFIACGIKLPHLPWFAPRAYFDLYDPETISMPEINENDLDDIPEAGIDILNNELVEKIRKSGKYREAVVGYLACLSFADAQIGRLLDALDSSSYKDNTIIVFWCDHGWHLGEKFHWKKNTLWAEASRSPFFISVPGLAPENVTCMRPVNLIDIYPTLVELCGLPEKKDLEGVSLVPLLIDPASQWNRPSLCTRKKGNHALIDDRYRYIRYADGSEELYDHEIDPNEWTNLAENPGYNEIKNRLAAWLPAHNAEDAPEVEKKEYLELIEQLTNERLSGVKGQSRRPSSFILEQNYPNPFNPLTTIPFYLKRKGTVRLSVHNAGGQLIETLLEQELSHGHHSVIFDAQYLSSGTYYYKLDVDKEVMVRKMLFVR
jgi:arylsulfatase A-like enzyme